MICPDCHANNIEGADYCEECGADLRNLDLPSPEDEFTAHLVSDHLGDVEVPDAPICAPSDPLALAIHLMQRQETGSVLVYDEGELVGILTERDVLLKAAEAKADLNALTVMQIMTPDPVILYADDSLAVALHKMSVGGFRHIPLVEDAGPPKVVSVRHLLRHVMPFMHAVPKRVP